MIDGRDNNTIAAPPAPLPAQFGPFKVIDVLGEGGMGVVYRAQHRESGERVAIKTVSIARRERLVGIRSEIVGLTRFQHPGIVRFLAHGVEDGVPWYAMELLEGRTLSDYLTEVWPERGASGHTSTGAATVPAPMTFAPFPPRAPVAATLSAAARPPAAAGRLAEIIAIFRAICEPLAYLHGKGVVHRDLKPQNLFIRRDGTPVLMDFGLISRARGSVGREALEFGGRLVGTVLYVSPEQIRREAIDARTDLYALGCMLYEAVTGLAPFRALNNQQILNQHLYEPPVAPSSLVNDLEERLERLILELLAKKRRERIGHADDVARMLNEIAGGLGAAAPAPKVQSYLFRPEVVGRDEVLAQFSTVLDNLRDRKGSMVLLGGESGIGKTFLAAEVSKLALIRGLRVVAGECAPPGPQVGSGTLFEGRGQPMAPLRPLFVAVADFCREGGAPRTQRLLGNKAKIIAPYMPSIAELPGIEQYPDPPDLPGDEAHRRLVESVLETMAAFAHDGPPLLIVLDDLQWADELSFKILASFSPQWLADKGVTIVGSFRSDEAGEEIHALAARPGVRNIEIGRMDVATVGQIAADMLAIPKLPPTYVSFVAQHTEGVPFFVAEYLRMAVAEGILAREGGRWTFKGGELSEANLNAMPIPRSIHDIMVRRLAGIGDDLRAVVETASAIGREVDFELLAAAGNLSEEVATERARELVQRQIFEAPEIGRYRFVHDKLRESAYSALAPARREALHRDVAHLLETRARDSSRGEIPYGELARHFTQGKLWDKAIDYLEKAGEQAFASFAHNEAIGFLRTANTLAAKAAVGVRPIRLARWERHLVDSHLNLGKMALAHEHAEKALRHCGYRLPSSRLGWMIGLGQQIGLRMVQRLLPRVFRVGSAERRAFINEAAYVLNRLCEPFFLSQRIIEGFYCGFRDLNLADRVPASEALARGYATMAMVVGVGPAVKLGRAWSERGVAIARSMGIPNAISYCLSRSGVLLMTLADWTIATERMEESVAGARARSDLRQLGESLTTLAMLHTFHGDFERCRKMAEEIIVVGRTRGDSQLQQWGRNLTVHSLLRLGRARESTGLIAEMTEYHATRAMGKAEQIFDSSGFALSHLMLGELDAAREKASAVRSAIRKEAFLPYFLKSALDATCEVFLALLERADPTSPSFRELRVETREVVDRLKKFASLYLVARSRAQLAEGQLLWLEGRSDPAFSAWRGALALAETTQVPYDEARARLEIGRHLERGGVTAGADGVAHLKKAAEIFRALGAIWDLAQCEDELARAGVTGVAA